MRIYFAPHHVKQIVAGQKTETRRRWDTSPVAVGEVIDAWLPSDDCRFCHGSSEDPQRQNYACAWCLGSTKVPAIMFARLRLVDVRDQRVGDFNDDDARAEGYNNVFQIWDGLVACYGELDLDLMMVVVRFELAEDLSAKSAEEIKQVYKQARDGNAQDELSAM